MSISKPQHARLPSGLVPDHLEAQRILHDAEIPVLYLTRTVQGQELLAYVADVNESGVFTVLVPITATTLLGLERGSATILEALSASPPWLHWTDGNLSEAWPYSLTELPKGHLPDARLHLHLEQEPIFRTRAVGDAIVLGRIPASAVAFVADSTRMAIKTILDYTFAVNPEGRPSDQHRTLYDLPIQGFAFASFELSFAAPDESVFPNEAIRQAAAKLERGLAWAAAGGSDAFIAESPEDKEVILQAVLFLTPPSTGPIKEVHLSGGWVEQTEIVLTRASRRKVREALKDIDEELPSLYAGRLGELDTDRFTFILRDMPNGQEMKGSFSEELIDDMVSLLTRKVLLAGLVRRGKFTAVVVVEDRTVSDETLHETRSLQSPSEDQE